MKENSETGNIFQKEIMRCFGVQQIHELVRWSSDAASFTLRLKAQSDSATPPIQLDMTLAESETSFSCDIPASTPLSVTADQLNVFPRLLSSELLGWMQNEVSPPSSRFDLTKICELWSSGLVSSVLHNLLQPLSKHRAYYLPADRAGLMHSFNVIVRALFQEEGSFPSGIVNDYLAQLVSLGNTQTPLTSNQGVLIQDLEQNVLGGRIKAARSQTQFPDFSFEDLGSQWQIPLPRASSMVSELAPIVLFLQNLVDPKDIMIIEEPESHLHPAAQATMAGMLVRLAKSGIRVIVTTHSDWLLDRITNMVGLSQLGSNQDSDVSLPPDQLGVWLFQSPEEQNGTVVDRIEYDEESGTYPVGYGDIAVALYNEWAETMNSIEQQSENAKG